MTLRTYAAALAAGLLLSACSTSPNPDSREIRIETRVGGGAHANRHITQPPTPRLAPRAKVRDRYASTAERAPETRRKGLAVQSPLPVARLSSHFGKRVHPIHKRTRHHGGLDLAAPEGTPIVAAADGVVIEAKTRGGYGLYVRIRHTDRFETAYAHLSRYAKGVTAGTRVSRGDLIGYVGMTGTATGPHLHFETFVDAKKVNPLRYVGRTHGQEVASR